MLPESFTPEFLRQLELLKIRARRSFLGTRQGGHLSPKRGHGIEFSDYRKYELGDNPRNIDWGVYARSDKLYVKRFQEEQDLSVLIIVDTSPSMSAHPSDAKWLRAKELALALSYVALMQQDSVVVAAPGFYLSPRYSGAQNVHSLSNALSELHLEGNPDFLLELQRALSRIRFPGVAVVISDFLMPFSELEKIFTLLRSRNLDITALQVLGPNDINPLHESLDAFVVDSESGEELDLVLDQGSREEYSALLLEHNHKLENLLAEGRIAYGLTLTTEPLGQIITESLRRTGLTK